MRISEKRNVMQYKAPLFLFIVFLLLPAQAICNPSSKQGILIWFYSLEVRENKKSGNMVSFKQTAGATYEPFVVNDILPLNPQSKVSKEKDGNWYLEFPLIFHQLLGSIPGPDGVLSLSRLLPPDILVPLDVPLQAGIGMKLSNLCLVEID